MAELTEQPAESSTNGKAEASHTVEINPGPKPGHPKVAATTTTLFNWLKKQREERPKKVQGKIHRVPDLLQPNESCSSYYQPKVVSLGPYHFGEEELSVFQKLKPSMADKLVPDKDLQASMRSEIKKNMDILMGAYSVEMKTEEQSEWEDMLFLDGCFVLHFIFCIMYDRVEDLEIQRYEIDLVHNDLFLAENQLPFKLLKILSGNDDELLDLVDEYIHYHIINNDVDWNGRQDEPVHLLDRLRTTIIGDSSETQKWQWQWQSTPPPRAKSTVLRHAKELTARGIHLKPNRTGFLNDIYFRSHFIYGTLRLPRIIVDDSTRVLFLNLAAYEMCADVDSTIISYICFLDSLVNHADDIKELQSAGVLVNHLATDEDAAKLFNEMSQSLSPDKDAHIDAKRKIQRFLENKTKASIASWIAEGYHNHFKSPLTAMAVLAAFLALGLAATQTYFTIFPRGNNYSGQQPGKGL